MKRSDAPIERWAPAAAPSASTDSHASTDQRTNTSTADASASTGSHASTEQRTNTSTADASASTDSHASTEQRASTGTADASSVRRAGPSASTIAMTSVSGTSPMSGAARVAPPPPEATARWRTSAAPGSAHTEDETRTEDDGSRDALGPIGLLLRDPAEVARRCLEEEGVRALTLASLGALVLGAAVFGGVVGSFRGGVQIAYGAAKVPLAMVAALVVCVPAFHAIAASLGRAWPLRTVVSLTVAAAGRAALVLFAFAPVLWLAYDLGLGYHAAALAAAGAYAIAGLAALGILLRGLGDAKHKLTTAAAFVAVFLAAAGQTGWMLRPYLVRPQSDEVPLVRAREGGFADAIYGSTRSALGIYDRAAATSRALEDEWDGCDPTDSRCAPYSRAPEGASR